MVSASPRAWWCCGARGRASRPTTRGRLVPPSRWVPPRSPGAARRCRRPRVATGGPPAAPARAGSRARSRRRARPGRGRRARDDPARDVGERRRRLRGPSWRRPCTVIARRRSASPADVDVHRLREHEATAAHDQDAAERRPGCRAAGRGRRLDVDHAVVDLAPGTSRSGTRERRSGRTRSRRQPLTTSSRGGPGSRDAPEGLAQVPPGGVELARVPVRRRRGVPWRSRRGRARAAARRSARTAVSVSWPRRASAEARRLAAPGAVDVPPRGVTR